MSVNLRDELRSLADIEPTRDLWADALARVGSGERFRPPRRQLRRVSLALSAGLICAAIAATVAIISLDGGRGSVTTTQRTGPIPAAGPGQPATPVASAAAADALLPFTVVVPSNADATSMSVYPGTTFVASYDTPDGSFRLAEGPSDITVAGLRALAQTWQGAVHEIVQVSGVSVLVQGDPDGYTTASWIRGDGNGGLILTFVQGPGVKGQTFNEQDALAIAANMITQGG